MTLSMAWVRDVGGVQELVMATDSRLRSPLTWDTCPKILPLGRSDSALCFAGPTHLAYPMMLQLQAAVRLHPKTLSRATDLFALKGHFLAILNGMRQSMAEMPSQRDQVGEEVTFLLLAGYSWRQATFAIWTLHFDREIDAFTFRPATPWPGVDGYRLAAIVGDRVDEAKSRLIASLRETGKLTSGGLDMEPLAVLRDMIRDHVDDAIGGPPQLVKVYRHMNVTPFGVYWPNRAANRVAVFGRPLLDYEQPGCPVLDLDTFQIDDSPVAMIEHRRDVH